MMLNGKRIIITGAASGIGLGSARFFESQGATLIVTDRDGAALNAAWKALPAEQRIQADVVDEIDCDHVVEAAMQGIGGLDGIFHCAGISDVVAPALELATEDWQRVIDINLRGTFLMCRSAGRVMVNQRSGSIVTTSSVNGLSGIPRRHAYGPAKAAIAQLTRTLACEWGNAQVRVNALAPTYVATPMIDRLAREGKVDIARLERRTPMGRIAAIEDVARAAAFLLSDWSTYITGVILPVDGGWTAYGGPGDVATA
jgi:NAD(P)-dependent dehydrogenase (short-subunit alcohol dehydrogenase family)